MNGVQVNVKLNAIICDAPAKAFVCGIKGHSGYFGCGKCTQEGDFIQNRVVFPEVNNPLRMDTTFKRKTQPEHHIRESCLEKLGLEWFHRLPRTLLEVDNWKATEFRQFLLYSGPILLLNRLPNIYYEHFVSLSVALRILIDSELCFKLNKYAESLLVWFVKFYGDLYGEEFLSYNVHNLIHLAADVKELGSLDKFSAFKFENFMQEIKHKLQNSGNYLQQFVNRLREEMCLSVTYENSKKYPIIFYCKNNVQIVDYIQFDGFTISKSKYDNCILLHNGMYGIVNDITVIDNNCELCINRFSKSEPFFSLPCDSRKHGIAIIDLKEIQKVTISVKSIKRKCIMFDYSKYKYVFLPLLHSD
ncbi:hypothetical protein PPYR_11406 [Photinus pyralis]|uniref:DUF4218 domain-containing protein n=1 Tax=Photinus pyralis TaxID=7054 RepID=A0A5N4AB72_PHOPY|nr:hypothetical protein PPYR_11406 [Photinus pyralis]